MMTGLRVAASVWLVLIASMAAGGAEMTLTFDGVIAEHRIAIGDLSADMPADWSDFTHLVMEMRCSSPQRFGLWVYTKDGPRRIEIQPFGQNVWLRASVPLQFFRGMDRAGHDLASASNRRTDSFWMSIWGPWGDLKSVESIGFAMEYPIHSPTIELRNVHLAMQDEGSKFLTDRPVLDEFNQWTLSDWPRKIHSREQLDQELADEAKSWGSGADFSYAKFGGYASTQAKATGFFHVEQIDGVWWLIDPEGHYFLSTSSNGVTRSGFGGRSASSPATTTTQRRYDPARVNKRLDAWGFNTGGQGRPNIVMLRWNNDAKTTFLGIPDVWADDYAKAIDASAKEQCSPLKDDPLVIGYFVGNEPPWGGRENEVVEMILAGPETATKAKLKEHLKEGDTPRRRREFVTQAFDRYLSLIGSSVKKYDPNHLNMGIRFGGSPSEEVLIAAGKAFDVCSINVYEYEPIKQLTRTYRYTNKPILIGEFHIGVPENGLGAGLVQAKDQAERGVAYRYFVEQAMSLPCCVGVHWFTWRDEPVLGRFDGENYNIGLVDVTDRPYPELIEAAKTTHKRMLDVHGGKTPPFSQRPKASDAGAPATPWGL